MSEAADIPIPDDGVGVLKIDTREKDPDTIREVERVAEERDVPTVEEHLESGDYVYVGSEATVAIEYKGISDAVNSALNDRLFEQANRMAEEYDRAYVFIVGKISEVKLRNRNIGYAQSYGQVVGAMSQILATMNVPCQWLQTKDQFGDIGIRTIIDAGEKGVEDNEMLLISPGVANDYRMSVLMGPDGSGRADAKKILDTFGSVRAAANARVDEFVDIPGFGMKKARRYYNTFRTEWDGEPGFDSDHTKGHVWNFLTTKGVGDDILLDIYAGTDELESSVKVYLEEHYPDMRESKKVKIIEAAASA